MKRRASTVAAILAVLLLALSAFLFWRASHPVVVVPHDSPALSTPPEPTQPLPPTTIPPPQVEERPAGEAGPEEAPEEDDGLPTDKFFITAPRKKYQDGTLRLIIPKLEVDTPILDGVDKDTLRRGVGLYDYAQLPSEKRSNTSIAGHRNQIYSGKIVLDQPFSYLDLLGEGDYLYLRDEENIYQYVFEYQQVITPDDWGPIYKTDHSCVTLTTCTPIGVSDHRLVVRAKLTDTVPVSEDYPYPSHINKEATE